MLRPTNPAIDPALPPRGEAINRSRGADGGRIQSFFRLTIRTVSSPVAQSHEPQTGDSRAHPHDSHGHSAGAAGGSDRWAYLRNNPPHQPGNPAAADPGQSNRLNLLLSWGGWQNESWVDRLPALLEPMGVHSLRVRTAREAEKAIRQNPVHIAVVDLGLPLDSSSTTPAPASEEAGPRVLELLRRLESPPPTVVVQQSRSARDATRHMSAALRCDAFAVVDRAAADVELMLKVLQRCMQRFYQGRWPGSQ